MTRRAVRGLAAVLVVAGLCGAPVVGRANAVASARDEIYPVPPSGVFTFHGRGFGHGHGLSQWGAYGAAKVGHLSANQILHFYYPHTTLATLSTTRTIHVLITAANAPGTGYLEVAAAPGLTVTPAHGQAEKLATKTSTHKAISDWRLTKHGASMRLVERAAGKWIAKQTVGSKATFRDTEQVVPVVQPGGFVSYRGAMIGEIESGSMEAVDHVKLEQYIDSVVPAEMPSSWSAAALQAQAVAARTYARRGLDSPKTSWFDVYGDTRDQAYGGVGRETAPTTKATTVTAGETIVDSTGKPVLAQYASADGGWTVSGGVDYLPSKRDPYDGAVPNDAHAWTTSVAASSLTSVYPQVGTLLDLDITGRDGNGLWGGRVTGLTLVGTKGSVSLTGIDLQFALGLRSPWFRPIPTPGAPLSLKAKATGSTVTTTWKPPAAISGAAKVTAYRFTLLPGTHVHTVAATALTESVSKLPVGTHTITVSALSAAGAGPPATVVVKTAH